MRIPILLSLTLVILVLLSACTVPPLVLVNAPSELQNDQRSTSFSTAACPFRSLSLGGVGTNVTVNAASGVSFDITCGENGLRAVGSYDSVNLFGTFDLPGRVLPICYGVAANCLQFSGKLLLGDKRSGFPAGTKADYVMSVSLSGMTARGAYQLAPVGIYSYPQSGILELFPKSVETTHPLPADAHSLE